MTRVTYIECDTCHQKAFDDESIRVMGMHFNGGLDRHECDDCSQKEAKAEMDKVLERFGGGPR